jgi:glutamyl/glutaminyl-tRNA synthetase
MIFSLILVGHARTFWIAQQRAQLAGGILLLRIEDLDGPRCKPHFLKAMIEDLKWFGFTCWQVENISEHHHEATSEKYAVQQRNNHDPWAADLLMTDSMHADKRARSEISREQRLLSLIEKRWKHTPIFRDIDMSVYVNQYQQSRRIPLYEAAWLALLKGGFIYPSPHSRKDVMHALSAPNEGDEEIIFPTQLRPEYMTGNQQYSPDIYPDSVRSMTNPRVKAVNWRFLVPDGRKIVFNDINCGQKVSMTSSTAAANVNFPYSHVLTCLYLLCPPCPVLLVIIAELHSDS